MNTGLSSKPIKLATISIFNKRHFIYLYKCFSCVLFFFDDSRQISKPSSAVRPVRPWPDHFFGRKWFWPDQFFFWPFMICLFFLLFAALYFKKKNEDQSLNIFWLCFPVHLGSLKRIDYPKQLSGPPSFF